MKINTIKKIVQFLDYYTFGIYLIHWYVLVTLIKIFNIDDTSIVFRLFAPFVIVILSVVAIYIIRKIPILKRSVP